MSFDLTVFRLRPGFTVDQVAEFDEEDQAPDGAGNPCELLSAAQLSKAAQVLRSHDQALSEPTTQGTGLSLTGPEGYSWDLDSHGLSLNVPYSLSPQEQAACTNRIGECIEPLRAEGYIVFDPQLGEELTSMPQFAKSLAQAFRETAPLMQRLKVEGEPSAQGKTWWRFW